MRALLHGVFLVWCSAVLAQPPLSDAAFSKSFRCPEDLPTDQDRKDSLAAFLDWAEQAHPGLTIDKAVELRVKLLEEHRCEKSLRNIHQSALAKNNQSRYLCSADDGKRYFTAQSARHCAPVPLEHGWVNIRSASTVVVDVMPSKIVREQDGTKIWTQFFLAWPESSEDGNWNYDHVRGITKFFCKTKQRLLIQATYSLNSRPVYNRSSAESIVEEIEPGTLAEGLYEYACKH